MVVLQVSVLALEVRGAGQPDAKIIGGSLAEEKQFPYQVSLQWGSDHICGGTVYDERNVITAAHCCDGEKVRKKCYYL